MASISKIEIKRTTKNASLTIHTSRPGLVIGKGGVEVDSLKKTLKKLVGYDVQVNVFEIKRPALVSKLVGESIVMGVIKYSNINENGDYTCSSVITWSGGVEPSA